MPPASIEETDAHVLPFPVVGVGASAGGLDAIRELVREVPVDANLAILIVMHLDPAQPSQLTEILGRSTAMKAVVAEDEREIQKGNIYVIPPNTSMSVQGGRIRLIARDRLGPPMPIDDLLDSLAEDQRSNAVGVILSGSGSDGAIGLQAVKECGGTAFVQDEASALFGSMPRAAMSLGCVDAALSPAAIGQELARLARHPYLTSAAAQVGASVVSDKALAQVLKELKRTSKIDFSHYKRGTIDRRIARRVALRAAPSVQEYLPLLENEPAEAAALCGDLLIKYTRFFRDPDSFKALTSTVLPRIFQDSEGPVRVWVPGCATGEEVYSIAIAMTEYLEGVGRSLEFQIFATDVSEDALETARAGRYIENIERDVSPERLRRFFDRVGAYYRISKSLRECCTFARQNVVHDAPFSRINLISCRNLLIYLDATLQRRVLPFFHFSLVPNGVLMLGRSETVGSFSDAFAPLDGGHSRIFVKKPLPHRLQVDPEVKPDPPPEGAEPTPFVRASLPSHEQLRAEFDRIVLSRYAPACVLCDDDLNIVEFKGDTSAFLVNPAGPPTLQLPRLVRPELFLAVNDAVRQVRKDGIPNLRNGVRIHLGGEVRTIDLEVVPVRPKGLDGSWYVIAFHASAAAATASRSSNVVSLWRGVPARLLGRSTPSDEGGKSEVARLNEELGAIREQTRVMLEEHESAIEELRTLEEEALASNEEFQITNEELVSSKEEQQSINEELATTNDELRYRNRELKDLHDEITQARDYAEAVLETMSEPLLVLDSNLRVSRANRAYYDAFRTTPGDTLHCELYALRSHQWDIFALRKLLEDLLQKQTQVRDYDLTARIPQVGLRSLRVNARRVAWPDHAFILMTLEDTTERDQALQKLVEGGRHKDEFLAMLAHELRNPLAAMRNALEILKGSEGSEGGEKEAQQILERQLLHQVRLVDDLLDVSRITQGLVMIKSEPVDLAQPIRHGHMAMRRQIAENRHQVNLMLPADKIMVNGDIARLEQVVSNLLSNAIKYTPDGGTIDITLERDQAMAVLSVGDSGIGMAADFLDKAFDIFVQADQQLDRTLGGLGVGLTLVRRLVELHGGTVKSRSPGLGQGSTFIVRLPLISPEEGSIDIAEEGKPPHPIRPRRVLVVDDNDDLTATTAILLEMSGHQAMTAKDGPSALAMLEEFDPEVVLLDIGLPGMDGFEVCRNIRRSASHANVLILALSGYGGRDVVEKATEAGFDSHLTKPASFKQIADVLRLYDERHDRS